MTLIRKGITSRHIWDTCIFANAPQALFQSWDWGEVEKKLGRKIWQYGWFEGMKLVAVAQIEKVPARRGTFLHVRHGPVLSAQKKDYWKGILIDLKELAKREHAWFIRVSPQIEDSANNNQFFKELGFLSAPIHAMDAELCWVLDLNESEEALMSGMRKTTRYEIRHAQKLEVVVQKSTDSRDVKAFRTLYDATSERHGFVGHTGIDEEFNVFSKEHNAELYTAIFEGKLLAAAIILYFGSEAIYHHGASIPSKIPASYLIQWEAIREAKKRGKKLYNFWGIAPEDNANHPWRGITLFKKGFGGREMEFMHAQDYPVSPLYVIPKTIESIRKRLKGY